MDGGPADRPRLGAGHQDAVALPFRILLTVKLLLRLRAIAAPTQHNRSKLFPAERGHSGAID